MLRLANHPNPYSDQAYRQEQGKGHLINSPASLSHGYDGEERDSQPDRADGHAAQSPDQGVHQAQGYALAETVARGTAWAALSPALILWQAPVIPSGPAWAVALVLGAGGVVLIIREIGKLLATRKNGGVSHSGVESRMAGAETATLLSEIRESRRQVGETHEIVTTLAKLGERSAALLEQVTAVVVKTDTTLSGMSEATQAMSRMLQLHTGLLDKSALQIDAIFTRTEGSQAAIKAILKKKRRKGK